MAPLCAFDDTALSLDQSTFDKPRLFTSSAISAEKDATRCSFITLLTAAQRLGIPLIPETWRPREALVGEGGTSLINQALFIKEKSLVFKRVAEEDRHNQSVEAVYQRLVNEMTVLYHPAIREHPNILGPLGICWDVSPSTIQDNTTPLPSNGSNYMIWPVLVFEKSRYGDLYQFSSLPTARKFDIIDRLKICLDVGAALGHMQLNHIIHGDIKPQNVLIMQDMSGFFSARVADFGFATPYSADSSSRVVLFGTPLWRAPEMLCYPDFTPAEAMRTDVFSFGMLCLWFMFDRYLSGTLPLPPSFQFEMETSQEYGNKHLSLRSLDKLKRAGNLLKAAISFVDADPDLSASSKHALQKFFIGCLETDPLLREANISNVLHHLDIHMPQRISILPLDAKTPPKDDEFDLCCSLQQYYITDYRVRATIFHSLEKIVAERPTSTLSKQLEFCYELGFGHTSNYAPPRPRAYDEEEIRLRLHQALNNEPETTGGNDGLQDSFGMTSLPLLIDTYIDQDVLTTAESVSRHEMDKAIHIFGTENSTVVVLKEILGSIVFMQGRLDEAETLGREVLEANVNTLGKEHRRTLACMGTLATTYSSQGRFKEAENLERELVQLNKDVLGEEDTMTLVSMANLATTLEDQRRFFEAEVLLTEVVHKERKIFGPGHPRLVSSMGHLASTLLAQNLTQKASTWATEAMGISEALQGRDHHETLGVMSIMVRIRVAEHRVQEAEQLQAEILERAKRVLGQEHPDTLIYMHNLAKIWYGLDRHADAKDLLVSCVDLGAKVLGREHPAMRERLAELEEWGVSAAKI